MARAETATPVARRAATFVRERFPLGSYGPLIVTFAAAGQVPAAALAGKSFDPLRFVLCVVAVTAVFLHLRVVDELKDADADRRGRPDRPLPRGLVTETELRAAAAGLVAVAIVSVLPLGPTALLAFGGVFLFVLAADVDFGAHRILHRDLLVYALVHSPIVPLLLLFCWLAGGGPPAAPLVWLVALAWLVGLGIEIGRKTRASDEERPSVETYSAAVGQRPAALLVGLALAAAAASSAGYAWSAGAPTWTIAASVVAALVTLGITARSAGRLRAGAMQAATGVAALLLLVWPTIIALTTFGR